MNSPYVLVGIVGEQHCASQKLGFDDCTILFTVILITKQDNAVVDSKMFVTGSCEYKESVPVF